MTRSPIRGNVVTSPTASDDHFPDFGVGVVCGHNCAKRRGLWFVSSVDNHGSLSPNIRDSPGSRSVGYDHPYRLVGAQRNSIVGEPHRWIALPRDRVAPCIPLIKVRISHCRPAHHLPRRLLYALWEPRLPCRMTLANSAIVH